MNITCTLYFPNFFTVNPDLSAYLHRFGKWICNFLNPHSLWQDCDFILMFLVVKEDSYLIPRYLGDNNCDVVIG
jgi:hypothetical protein